MKRLTVNRKQCTGCESCVLTCSFSHEGVFALDWARIQISRDEEHGTFVPHVCVQCEGRFCVAACPVDALSVDSELGCIKIDESLCIRCKACAGACPFSGVHFVEGHRFPVICDLCGGEPACVATCKKPQAVQYLEQGENRDEDT